MAIPVTTPFAILYLATEGLYAEIASSRNGIAEKIQSTLNEMNQAVDEISKSIDATGEISEKQEAATAEITANLGKVKTAAEELKKYVANMR